MPDASHRKRQRQKLAKKRQRQIFCVETRQRRNNKDDLRSKTPLLADDCDFRQRAKTKAIETPQGQKLATSDPTRLIYKLIR